VATQLDHERFLVLLPYTDLKGASGLARRVIAAVAALDPVVTAGRALSPKLVGAVSGAQLGETLSFAKLMKDASRALEDARRDGAEFAVQP
jgi:PleD family two-component response regulator